MSRSEVDDHDGSKGARLGRLHDREHLNRRTEVWQNRNLSGLERPSDDPSSSGTQFEALRCGRSPGVERQRERRSSGPLARGIASPADAPHRRKRGEQPRPFHLACSRRRADGKRKQERGNKQGCGRDPAVPHDGRLPSVQTTRSDRQTLARGYERISPIALRGTCHRGSRRAHRSDAARKKAASSCTPSSRRSLPSVHREPREPRPCSRQR